MILRATVREDVPLNKGERTNLETQVEKPASDEHARGRKVSSKHYGDEGSEEFLPPAFIGIEQEPDEFSYRDAMSMPVEFIPGTNTAFLITLRTLQEYLLLFHSLEIAGCTGRVFTTTIGSHCVQGIRPSCTFPFCVCSY